MRGLTQNGCGGSRRANDGDPDSLARWMGIGGGGGRMCSPGWMRGKQQEERTAATLLGRGGRRYLGDRSGLVAGDVVFSHADLSIYLLDSSLSHCDETHYTTTILFYLCIYFLFYLL